MNFRKFNTSAVPVVHTMNAAGTRANHTFRPVLHNQTLTPTRVNAANNWLLVPKIVQNVLNELAGLVHKYRLGPAKVITVAIAPPDNPFSPVISCNTYRPSRVHTSSVSNTKLENASKPKLTAIISGTFSCAANLPMPTA